MTLLSQICFTLIVLVMISSYTIGREDKCSDSASAKGKSNCKQQKPKTKNVPGKGCSGEGHRSKATAYYSDEGVDVDCKGNELKSLQDFVAGAANYVSIAIDSSLKIPYGTSVCIPELNALYGKNIDFKVVDTAPSFTDEGYGRVDICVSDEEASTKPSVNGQLTLHIPESLSGSNYCEA